MKHLIEELREFAGESAPEELAEARGGDINTSQIDKAWRSAFRAGRASAENTVIKKAAAKKKPEDRFEHMKSSFDFMVRNLSKDLRTPPQAVREMEADIRDGLMTGRAVENNSKAILRWAARAAFFLGALQRLDEVLEPLGNELAKTAPEP